MKMNPTEEKHTVESMKGVKAFCLKGGELTTGGIGGSKHTVFEVGETYEVPGEASLCSNGFHFFETRNACFGLKMFGEEETVLHEIEAFGEIISDTEKCVCSKIRIGERVTIKIDTDSNSGDSNSGDSNSGDSNSGDSNSGDSNSGSWNSGDSNSGDRNSGSWNSGYRNSGDRNSGDRNSGYRNSGYRNSGYRNSGDRNSGDSNSGSWNSGDSNSGDSNSGDSNSGYRNSGDRNSGDRNSGDRNSGSWNSGYSNSGSWNSGDSNSGDSNSGDRNSGYRNSGSWNSCNYDTGFFNSEQSETVRVFNAPCPLEVWENADKPSFLYFDMQEGESYKDAFRRSWDNASSGERSSLENLPNFSWDVFTEISGIKRPAKE